MRTKLQAKDEIAAIEEVLHPELGGERITNMGKVSWRSVAAARWRATPLPPSCLQALFLAGFPHI